MPKQSSVIATLSDQLRRDISLGVIRPGDKLNIEALKRTYSVSHPSVREALSLLVGEGYVGFQESKGFRALDSSPDEQQDNIRLRAEFECIALEWSIARTNVDWRSSVVAAHYALSEIEQEMPGDPMNAALEWEERNRSFHAALVGNCDSPKLLGIIETQYNLSRRYRLMAHAQDRSQTSRARWVETSAQEHRLLKDAALEGDTEMGKRVLRQHIKKAALHVVEDAASIRGVMK
ncbi:GntR family transcriptional regulator [uncultured Litoreibacter sp.]|uniref:GntR family transcriptional regulator n=1 Tax=uncultured Litoreibacter sp. TaxID=1392394 RepID=UPI00260C9E20|nr:FCD domain-containing protein [uncultured Litoreibacter sp.]